MLLSVSILIHLPILFLCFIAYSYSQSNTINKVCGVDDSTCGAGQTCVNSRCECDPNQRRFWAGDKFQCRVCPQSYIRQPTRCYKPYAAGKNHSAARADCRQDQADLFSWRDNSDEDELITASLLEWNSGSQSVQEQLYSWSGGIVNHGGGSIADYRITWYDPKAPVMRHPNINDPNNYRYCNAIMMANYQGDAEPTRQTKNGETEDCVSFVFIPDPNSRGQLCMADDFCSTEMSYICELTEATIAGLFPTPPPPNTDTKVPVDEPSDIPPSANVNYDTPQGTETPAALTENEGSNQSNKMIYGIGGILFLAVVGAVAFIIIRKRKQQNKDNTQVTPANSMDNSNTSDADV